MMQQMKMIGAAALFLLVGMGAQSQDRGENKPPTQSKSAPAKQAPPKAPAHATQTTARAAQAPQPKAQSSRPGSAGTQRQAVPTAKPAQAAKTQPDRGTTPTPRTQAAAPAPTREAEARPTRANAPGPQRPPQRSQAEVTRQRAQPALRLSARGSVRIPEARFQANFGDAHRFSIGAPVLTGGYSRFQYGGFWFGFVQPWPTGWYYTDQVYIVYTGGGYFLMNPFYPTARVSISVVL